MYVAMYQELEKILTRLSDAHNLIWCLSKKNFEYCKYLPYMRQTKIVVTITFSKSVKFHSPLWIIQCHSHLYYF
jgi:hypothetical protein